MAYLNCPECFYRVRTETARTLDGQASCPRCSRLGRLVAMYSTELALRPNPNLKIVDSGETRLGPPAGEVAG